MEGRWPAGDDLKIGFLADQSVPLFNRLDAGGFWKHTDELFLEGGNIFSGSLDLRHHLGPLVADKTVQAQSEGTAVHGGSETNSLNDASDVDPCASMFAHSHLSIYFGSLQHASQRFHYRLWTGNNLIQHHNEDNWNDRQINSGLSNPKIMKSVQFA